MTAARLLSAVEGDFDWARWLLGTRPEHVVLALLVGPVEGPLMAYDPRCTGPIPDGLRPFGSFMYSRVEVSPTLARELARWAPEGKAVSGAHVRVLASAMVDADRPWTYSPGRQVVVDDRGRVVDGLHLLLAIVNAGRTIELDVCHNFPAAEWARLERGRRRSAADALSFKGRSSE